MAKEAKGAGRPKRAESATAKHLVKSREKILAAIERRRESTAAAAEKAARCIESFDNRPKEHIEAATARPVPPGNPPRCACGTCIKPEALIQRRIKAADWKSGGVLAKIDAKRTELQGHLISGPFDKKAADAALRELEGKEAVLITMATKMTLQMTTPALTPPSLVYHPDQPPISPRSPGSPPAQSPQSPPLFRLPRRRSASCGVPAMSVLSRVRSFLPWNYLISRGPKKSAWTPSSGAATSSPPPRFWQSKSNTATIWPSSRFAGCSAPSRSPSSTRSPCSFSICRTSCSTSSSIRD
jgi:hypothetical protein